MNLMNLVASFVIASSEGPKIYVSSHGEIYYQTEGKKIDFRIAAKKNIIKIPLIKKNCSIFVDPENGIYVQDKEVCDIPKGMPDALTFVREIIENPVPGSETDTIELYIDKRKEKIIVKRHCSQDSSRREVSIRCLDEKKNLGGGTTEMDFYSANGLKYPLGIYISNKYLDDKPIPFLFDAERSSRKP